MGIVLKIVVGGLYFFGTIPTLTPPTTNSGYRVPLEAGEVFRCPTVNMSKDGRSIRQKCKTNWDKIDGPPGRKAGGTFLAAPHPWRDFGQKYEQSKIRLA